MTDEQLQEVLHRARHAYRLGDFEEAERALTRVLEGGPDESRAYVLLGNLYARTGRVPQAVEAYRTAIDRGADKVEALNNLGVVYRQQGDHDRAVSAFRRALELAPDRADVHYNLGNSYKAVGRAVDAVESYRRALSLNPELTQVYNNLATLHQSRSEPAEAIAAFEQGLERDPNNPHLHYNLGIAYQEQGRLDEAAREFRLALRSRPGWIDALNNLGNALEQEGKYEEALGSYREILSIVDGHAAARNNMGTIYARQGFIDRAIEAYREALRTDRAYVRAAMNLAHLLASREETEPHLNELRSLVDQFPERWELRCHYAHACVRAGRPETAARALVEGRRLIGEQPELLRLLGESYFRLGRIDEAEAVYADLTARDPEALEHHLDVAGILAERGDFDGALERIELFLQHRTGDFSARLRKADVLFDAGRVEEALEELSGLKAEYPDNATVLSRIARAHQSAGRHEDAVEAADELISLQGKRADRDDLSALNESLSIYESAVKAFAREAWERNLEKLGRLVRDAEEQPAVPDEARDLELEQTEGLEEDYIPILDLEDELVVHDEEVEEQLEALGDPGAAGQSDDPASGSSDSRAPGQNGEMPEGTTAEVSSAAGAAGAETAAEGWPGGNGLPGVETPEAAAGGFASLRALAQEQDEAGVPLFAEDDYARERYPRYYGPDGGAIETLDYGPEPPSRPTDRRIVTPLHAEPAHYRPRSRYGSGWEPAPRYAPPGAETAAPGPAPGPERRQAPPESRAGETESAVAAATPAGDGAALPAGDGAESPAEGRGAESESAEGTAAPAALDEQAGLLDYLLTLTSALPAEKRREFEGSAYRARVEELLERLHEGHGGATGAVARADSLGPHAHDGGRPEGASHPGASHDTGHPGGRGPGRLLTARHVVDTFRFLQRISEDHPDASIRKRVSDAVRHLISDIERTQGRRTRRERTQKKYGHRTPKHEEPEPEPAERMQEEYR